MKIYSLLFLPAVIMAYLNMNCRITIGNVVLNNIHSFTIRQSITEVSDSATIVLPRHYKMLNGKPVRSYINAGDEVTIEAGYNGYYKTEYHGYVERIQIDVPIEITCDALYPMRQNNIYKGFKSITLKELMSTYFVNYIVDCPEVQLGKLLLENVSSYQILEKLQREYGFYTKVYDGNKIHVGFIYDWLPEHNSLNQYTTGINIKDNQLKLRNKNDFANTVKLTTILPTGKKSVKLFNAVNPNGVLVDPNHLPKTSATKKEGNTVAYNVLPSQAASLEKMGTSLFRRINYTGAEGKITGFGIPRVKAGDSLEIKNPDLAEIDGRYIVKEVLQNYGPNGWERICEPGFKI